MTLMRTPLGRYRERAMTLMKILLGRYGERGRFGKIGRFGKNRNGIALISGLLVLSALTTIGLITVNITVTDLKISENMKDIRKAFFNAEAGIEHAIHVLDTSSNGFDDELSSGTLNSGSSTDLEDGTYEVHFTDNEDGDGDPNCDVDDTLIITSTGRSNGATQTVEVLFNKIGIPAEADGALSIYVDNPELHLYGSLTLYGGDWNLPIPFPCTGTECEGQLSGKPAVAGLYSTEALSLIAYEESSSFNASGDPNLKDDGSGTYTHQDWQNLAHHLIIQADKGNIHQQYATISDKTLGTRENPQITVFREGVRFSGTVKGAGILILREKATFQGLFYYEGLIIIINDGESNFIFDAQGLQNIFGSAVVTGTGSGSSGVDILGNPIIKYSRQALSNVSDRLSFPRVLCWRNT